MKSTLWEKRKEKQPGNRTSLRNTQLGLRVLREILSKQAEPVHRPSSRPARVSSSRGGKPQKGRRLRKEEMPRSPPGDTPKHPPSGEVHGRRGCEACRCARKARRSSGSDPTAETGRALKGRRSGGHRPRDGFGHPWYGLSGKLKALKLADPSGA
jgi:hypothetical protein